VWVVFTGRRMAAGGFCVALGLAHRLKTSLWGPKMLCRTSGLRHLYLDSVAREMDSLAKLPYTNLNLLLTGRAKADSDTGDATRRSTSRRCSNAKTQRPKYLDFENHR
jgi:hypothetical protein